MPLPLVVPVSLVLRQNSPSVSSYEAQPHLVTLTSSKMIGVALESYGVLHQGFYDWLAVVQILV